MEQGYSIGNVSRNLTKSQKIGLIFGGIILVLVLVLVSVIAATQEKSDTDLGDDTNDDDTVKVTENTYTDENGYTITQTTTTDSEGNMVMTETKEDEYGNETTTDPSLITTYFPYQVMREHTDWVDTLRYYLSADYENKVITGVVESCDEEADKALAQEYINSIPLDLSQYTVVFETFNEDAICQD